MNSSLYYLIELMSLISYIFYLALNCEFFFDFYSFGFDLELFLGFDFGLDFVWDYFLGLDFDYFLDFFLLLY